MGFWARRDLVRTRREVLRQDTHIGRLDISAKTVLHLRWSIGSVVLVVLPVGVLEGEGRRKEDSLCFLWNWWLHTFYTNIKMF